MSSESLELGKKLQKVYIEFDDPAGGLMQYQLENLHGDGLQSIQLPFELDTFMTSYIKVELYEKNGAKPVIVDGLEKLKYLALGSAEETTALREWKRANPLLDSLLPSYFEQQPVGTSFPRLEISDVTERDMFGYEAIPQSKLGDKGGIWAWHGLRKLEFSLEGLYFDEANKQEGEEQRVSLYFYKVGNEELSDVIHVEEIRYNFRHNVYVAYLNTNRLGKELERIDDKQPTFSGRFEVHIYNKNFKTVYSFPVNLCVHNTSLDDEFENHLLEGNGIVSIDFGTSSTCAAFIGTGRNELISLSGEGKRSANSSANQYENPTNLMIYSWDEFYRQWEHANKNCPFLIAKSDELDDSEADYDSGYTVDDILKDINDDPRGQRRVRAIISELKTIPSLKPERRQQIKIRPLNDVNSKVIYVTDTFGDEDENTLDPIAFYGYLLSRAINNPVNQKIYHTYKVAFPVKFEKKVRDKICESLARGIRRGMPMPISQAMEDGEPFIKVTMEYEESVACVGAVVGNQLVIDEESPKSKPFAIFDLGGGTLDTSYGIFRRATDDELDEGAEWTIQIFGCGGNERVGGEKMIHQLAYKIYLDNKDTIEAKEIPFVLPFGEKFPKGFEGLLTDIGDEISNANVSTLKENLARVLFQYSDVINGRMADIFGDKSYDGGVKFVKSGTECNIKLRDKSNKEVLVTLTVDGIEEFLEEKIRDIIEDFKSDMDTICGTDKVLEALMNAGIDDYHPEDFAIFLGGNASKQQYVEEIMSEIFPSNRIERIQLVNGEDENLSDRYRLNSKTAVAFGQLNLENYYVDKSTYQIGDEDRAPFPFNVGYKDPGSGKFITVLEKNNNSLEWSRANLIGRNDDKTQLLFTSDPKSDPDTLKPFNKKVKAGKDKKKRWLWIRVAPDAHNSIEYRLGGREENFDPDESMNENMIFELAE